jgi:hypothetical protein
MFKVTTKWKRVKVPQDEQVTPQTFLDIPHYREYEATMAKRGYEGYIEEVVNLDTGKKAEIVDGKKIIICIFMGVFMNMPSHAAITVKSSLSWMQKLGKTTECVIALPEFQAEINAITVFTYTHKNGKDVINDLSKMKDVAISTYRTTNPRSKTIAYTYGGAKTIYFNKWKNPRDIESMINTVIHESTHIVGYKHGDNKNIGKEKSVPYLVGSIAEKYVSKCK